MRASKTHLRVIITAVNLNINMKKQNHNIKIVMVPLSFVPPRFVFSLCSPLPIHLCFSLCPEAVLIADSRLWLNAPASNQLTCDASARQQPLHKILAGCQSSLDYLDLVSEVLALVKRFCSLFHLWTLTLFRFSPCKHLRRMSVPPSLDP